MKIFKYPDPFLFKKIESVIIFDSSLEDIGREMLFTMKQNNGVGLAANQVGVNKRMFVMQSSNNSPSYIFINPVIVNKSFEFESQNEACLSFPGIFAPIPRSKSITLIWKDIKGEPHEKNFDGFEAICIQHEVEHLDGIVFVNKLQPVKKAMIINKYNKILSQTKKS